MSNEQNIYQRMNAVMQAVQYVRKDRKVDTYMAVTYDNLIAVCRAEMVKQGIAVYPVQVASEMLIKRNVKEDVKMHLYSGTYDVWFVNIDKPDDRFNVRVDAHATDNGDKAPGKALTYAVKSAMLKALMLETGENEESRNPTGEGIDTDAVKLTIDACNDLESLRKIRTDWAAKCSVAKDKDAWAEIKAATEVRAKDLQS